MRNIRISKTAYYAITAILLLLVTGAGLFFWQKSRTLGDQNESLEATIHTLEAEKPQMEVQLDSLTVSYDLLRSENEDLRGKESATSVLIAEKDAAIKKIRSQTRRDLESLRKQLEDLRRISFDLADVPQQYQGGQKLYLSITDDRGVPVSGTGAVKTSVAAPAGSVPVIAQQVKAVALKDTQRLSFAYKPEDRLKSGNYVVAIYCDAGLLGAASFRLT